MNIVISLFFSVVFVTTASARFLDTLPIQEMFDEADLVVIAQPVSVKDLSERVPLPNIGTYSEIDPSIPAAERGKVMVLGLETDFTIENVVKGKEIPGNHFVLHHYKLAPNQKGLDDSVADGPPPLLVSFNPSNHQSYVLFLKKEADGRFAPVCGQVDPSVGGIFRADKFDLIVIAKPVSAKMSTGKIMNRVMPWVVNAYATPFTVQRVFKGDPKMTSFVFDHYESAVFPEPGPSFDPEPAKPYVLFLEKEPDAHFKSAKMGLSEIPTPPDLAVFELPDP